jgi:hypothetical protein
MEFCCLTTSAPGALHALHKSLAGLLEPGLLNAPGRIEQLLVLIPLLPIQLVEYLAAALHGAGSYLLRHVDHGLIDARAPAHLLANLSKLCLECGSDLRRGRNWTTERTAAAQ